MVHAACEALGVPILTSERYEADDVIGTLTIKAAAAGFDVAIVTGDKDFFQLVRRRHPRLQPARRRHVVRRGRREGEVRRRARAGRRRAGADGRHHRQHQGRAGHRRERRARADRHLRLAREPARPRVGDQAQAVPRRRCSPTSSRRATEPRARAIHTDVPVEFEPEALRYRGGSRERCFEIFNELGFRTLVERVRADRRHDRQDLPHRQHGRRRCERWPAGCAAAGRFALRVLPDQPSAMRAAIVGLAFSTAPHEADYVPIGPPRARRQSASMPLDAALEHRCGRCSRTRRS